MRDKKKNKVRVDIWELTPAPIRTAPATCFVTYSCHLIISQTAGAEADLTRLSIHLGALYFHRRSFRGGHRSTTPEWCVGVCSGPARVWVTGLAHPHRHDTAQNNRLARLPAEAGLRRLCGPFCVCSRRVFCTCVGGWECLWGGKNVSSTLSSCVRSHVCNAALGYFFQESVLFMLCVSTPPKAVCLFVWWEDYWCRREQKDNFLII